MKDAALVNTVKDLDRNRRHAETPRQVRPPKFISRADRTIDRASTFSSPKGRMSIPERSAGTREGDETTSIPAWQNCGCVSGCEQWPPPGSRDRRDARTVPCPPAPAPPRG